MQPDIAETYVVEQVEQAVALLHPLRGQILAHLRTPASAAEVARQMNEPPQKINYHLKTLEKTGLVRKTGTRQVRNLVEVLFQAAAKTFVLSDALGMSGDTVRQAKVQGVLAHLVDAADRLRQDAVLLMDRHDERKPFATAALHSTAYLPDEARRSAFVRDYTEVVRKLLEQYGARDEGGPDADAQYRVLLAVYPQPSEEKEERS